MNNEEEKKVNPELQAMGERMIERGEKMQETGKAVTNIGKSITGIVFFGILLVIMIVLLKSCVFS